MLLPLDEITRKKLVLVKQIYQRAVIDSKGSFSKTNRILSIIEFDLAVETTIKSIVSALDTTKTPESDISKLLQQANSLLKLRGVENIPDEAHIKHIRRIRNNAQHQAIYPNETDLSDCRTYARDFLTLVIKQIWDIDFENITLADLIEDEEIKGLLIEAYKQYDLNNFVIATDLITEAMDKAINHVDSALVGSFPPFINGIAVSDSFSIGRDDEVVRDSRHHFDEQEVLKIIKKMQETLLYLSLEMNISEFIRFRKIAGYTFVTMDDKYHRVSGKKEIDKNDVEFLLSYCIDTIVNIEERVGSLKKPFDSD